MLDLKTVLRQAIDRQSEELHSARRALKLYNNPLFVEILESLANLPSWDEVESVRLYCFELRSDIDLILREGLRDPQLVRDIVRAGICSKLDKEPHWDQRSLRAHAYLTDENHPLGRVHLEVRGYVPQSCRVEYDEIEVPARVEKRARIVCVDTN